MLAHYLIAALRNVRDAPFAAVVNLLTLAVGLVCFIIAYSFVSFWNGAERHFRNADDIYVLTISIKNRDNGLGIDNYTRVPGVAADFLESDYPGIGKMARAVVIDRQTMIASEGRAVRLFGVAVDPQFAEIFDLPFVAGDAQSALTSPGSAVLTREGAARLFGTENPIGKNVVIGNSVDARITGVIDAIPEPSHLGHSANASLPFDLLASRDVLDALRNHGSGPPMTAASRWFMIDTVVYLYLPPSGELSPAALEAQLGDFVARHVPPETRKQQKYRFDVVPVGTLLGGAGNFFGTGLSFATALLVLGGLVLGVACVNYANLATARASRRVREIGVRKALGASPFQIATQHLLEAAALTFAALIVALAAFILAQPLVKALLGAELDANFFSTLGVWPVLAVLVVAVTLAAGAYPALVLSRVRPVNAVGAAQARLGSPLFSALLVGTQFAIASFLLIAVTVISLQNAEMRRTALEDIADPLIVIENPTSMTEIATATLRERLRSVPQVRGVTEVRSAPWESLLMANFTETPDPMSPKRTAIMRPVGFDFFRVFEVPLLAGRVFDREHSEDLPRAARAGPGKLPVDPGSESGSSPGTPSAEPQPLNIVVDRSFTTTGLNLASPEDAIGKLVYRPAPPFPGAPPQAAPMRIIGVVEDRTFSFFKTPVSTAGATYVLQTDLELTVARVSATDIDGALGNIDGAWHDLAPNVAINRRFLDEIFERAYSYYVRVNELFGALAATAFAICIAGLFGMATFVAGRRRREIGVRKTLGGSTSQMVALLIGGFSKPVLVANLIAWPAGYLAARAYLNQFSTSIDLTPWPFVASVGITLAITLLAVVGQTIRAARTKPSEALRHE